jgi:hypothetical protein
LRPAMLLPTGCRSVAVEHRWAHRHADNRTQDTSSRMSEPVLTLPISGELGNRRTHLRRRCPLAWRSSTTTGAA